jgi:hypothetical protein
MMATNLPVQIDLARNEDLRLAIEFVDEGGGVVAIPSGTFSLDLKWRSITKNVPLVARSGVTNILDGEILVEDLANMPVGNKFVGDLILVSGDETSVYATISVTRKETVQDTDDLGARSVLVRRDGENIISVELSAGSILTQIQNIAAAQPAAVVNAVESGIGADAGAQAAIAAAIVGNLELTASGTGGQTRAIVEKLAEMPASVNDYATIPNALTARGRAFVPRGTEQFNIASAALGPAADGGLFGEGAASVLEFVNDASSGTQTAINLAGPRVTLQDIKLDLTSNANRTTLGIVWDQDDLMLDGVVADGNTTEVTGARSHVAQFVVVPSSGTQNGLTIVRAEVTGWTFGLLKANADTSTQNRIKVIGSYFHDNYGVDFVFNTPSGVMKDMLVLGTTFMDNLGETVGNSDHRSSFAGGEGFRFVANHAGGVGGALVRSEETAKTGVIALNTMLDGSEQGIQITDNDVGGVATTPEQMIIGLNALRGDDATASSRGIELVSDASTLGPLAHSIVGMNMLADWTDAGLRTSALSEFVAMPWNVVKGCGVGLRAERLSPMMTDLVLTDCTDQIIASRGGMAGRVHFRSTTPMAQVIDPLDATSFRGMLTGWTYESGIFTLPLAASTDYPIIALGTAMNGTIELLFGRDASNHTAHRFTINWDGTTLTYTTLLRVASGSIVTSSGVTVANVAGVMTLRIVNGTGIAQNPCFLQLNFNGMHTFA